MNITLLPGLDGTGHLFSFLRRHIPSSIPVEQYGLLQVKGMSYRDQAEDILARLNKDKAYILIAESYSGRIAYEMSLMAKNGQIRHIVFAASFLGKPSYLSQLASLLPIALVKKQWIPKVLVSGFLFGWHQREVTQVFYKALHETDSGVLRYRLEQVSKLKLPNQILSVPCTYIQAKHDNLVSPKAVEDFKVCCPELTVHQVPGKHFILQTQALECWKIIESVIGQLIVDR